MAKRKPRNSLIILWKKNSRQISQLLPHVVFVAIVLPLGIRTIANVHFK